eukprot:2525378-Amphidinium_carterae.1
MKVNLKKTVVICNGANAKRLLMKVWRAGRLPPPRVTTSDLGVDTQWAAWRCPVHRKRVITFKQSMNRVRSLGLPATSKARIAKSLYSVELYGAEVGGMSASHMKDVRISARKALGKGAHLRRSSPLELMAYGGPAGDHQVTSDLNTIRAWQRKLIMLAPSNGLWLPRSGREHSIKAEGEGPSAICDCSLIDWPGHRRLEAGAVRT